MTAMNLIEDSLDIIVLKQRILFYSSLKWEPNLTIGSPTLICFNRQVKACYSGTLLGYPVYNLNLRTVPGWETKCSLMVSISIVTIKAFLICFGAWVFPSSVSRLRIRSIVFKLSPSVSKISVVGSVSHCNECLQK